MNMCIYPRFQSFDSQSLLVLVGIISVFILSTLMSRRSMKISGKSRTALQALQTVLVPTCSLWPTRYIRLVKRASMHSDRNSRSKIVVPLSMLLQDVCDGVIELRDPVCDLEDLMDEGIFAYGCYVHLSIDWKWWVEWFDRVVRVYHPVADTPAPLNAPRHPDQLQRDISAPSPSVGYPSIIDLDREPLKHLATIQLPKGSRTTLQFTSLSSSVSVLSTTYILCMIPFLARRLPHRLSDVLAAADNTRDFKLSSLLNSSVTYADALAVASSTLAEDHVARKLFVDELGIKGWRERRLMLEFEAALVRKGWLEHWELVLEAC